MKKRPQVDYSGFHDMVVGIIFKGIMAPAEDRGGAKSPPPLSNLHLEARIGDETSTHLTLEYVRKLNAAGTDYDNYNEFETPFMFSKEEIGLIYKRG